MDRLSHMLASTHWNCLAWTKASGSDGLARLALALAAIGLALLLLECMA